MLRHSIALLPLLVVLVGSIAQGGERVLPVHPVEGQPLAVNVERLITALDYLGAPLPADLTAALRGEIDSRNGERLQQLLDSQVLLEVSIDPEGGVQVAQGPAPPALQQAGYTPHLIKVVNHGQLRQPLRIRSPQAGPVYSGASLAILERQAQTELIENPNSHRAADRFLEVEMFDTQPMTSRLSGLDVEYAVALLFSSQSGELLANMALGVEEDDRQVCWSEELPIRFQVKPAIPVVVYIRDADGQPTAARLEIRDRAGHVHPPQAKRLAPDFFFQPQIYRHDGQKVLLSPGEFVVTYDRGPEYLRLQRQITVPEDAAEAAIHLDLRRWIDPADYGFYSGDHHIHGAGCSHYDNPTQGVTPVDMFVQVKGEGLNVGCVLTWGPCFDYQRLFFSPQADTISEPRTVLKYDLEISGFGSAALGHVCLLNLRDQTYPNSQGGKDRGWPSWTVPVMRWAKDQGGVTGYPHSALHVEPEAAADRLIDQGDRDGNRILSENETELVLLPESFESIDQNGDGGLSRTELVASNSRAADYLPNLALPAMNGAGAMEIFVSTAEGVCDFISAMDTARISEWNTWYHLMNCGFPLKVSGETDFPCMSSRRVGQGRVYVQMGRVQQIDFDQWCKGVQAGRSYVSDGFAHALRFEVGGRSPGERLQLEGPSTVQVSALVAFAPSQPHTVAQGEVVPASGRRMVGDTVNLHAPRTDEWVEGGERLVELVVNGRVHAQQKVAADGKAHELTWEVPIHQSSWIALRQFPQLHTNPVQVIVDDRPIRASRSSAQWCEQAVNLLWDHRHRFIHPDERPAARKAYDRAIATYRRIAQEAASP